MRTSGEEVLISRPSKIRDLAEGNVIQVQKEGSNSLFIRKRPELTWESVLIEKVTSYQLSHPSSKGEYFPQYRLPCRETRKLYGL